MACLAAVSLSARSAQAGNCEHVFLRGCFPRRWSSSGQTPVCVAGHRERRPRRSRKPAAAAAGHSASTTRGHSPSQTVEDRRRSVVALGLRAVQNYEADFVMDTVAEEMLVEMLGSDTFCAQVSSCLSIGVVSVVALLGHILLTFCRCSKSLGMKNRAGPGLSSRASCSSPCHGVRGRSTGCRPRTKRCIFRRISTSQSMYRPTTCSKRKCSILPASVPCLNRQTNSECTETMCYGNW